MSKTFVASNGSTIEKGGGGNLFVGDPERNGYRLYPDHVTALREFFLHERDEELGRWRDPEYPHIFVRQGSQDDRVGVVKDNAEGLAYGQFRRGARVTLDPMSIVAHRYFAAHPEPKPWHDAEPDDVWKFTDRTGNWKALAWRSWDDWDVMTPIGVQISGVDDPVAALIENGYDEFTGNCSAVKMEAANDEH